MYEEDLALNITYKGWYAIKQINLSLCVQGH